MTSKALITAGLVWLAAVIVWVFFFDRDFAVGWVAPGPAKRVVLILGIYLAMFTYWVFLMGWLVPLGFGIYRLVRHPDP